MGPSETCGGSVTRFRKLHNGYLVPNLFLVGGLGPL